MRSEHQNTERNVGLKGLLAGGSHSNLVGGMLSERSTGECVSNLELLMFQRRRQAGGWAGENGEYPVSRGGTAELLEIIVRRPVRRL